MHCGTEVTESSTNKQHHLSAYACEETAGSADACLQDQLAAAGPNQPLHHGHIAVLRGEEETGLAVVVLDGEQLLAADLQQTVYHLESSNVGSNEQTRVALAALEVLHEHERQAPRDD